MKTKTVTIGVLTVMIVVITEASATIRIANNNPGAAGVNVYVTLQAAIDSSVGGDTIYVTPSLISYGGVVISKKLVIYGVGYSPEKDFPLTSMADYLILSRLGAGINSDPSNTLISGLAIGGSITVHGTQSIGDISGITVERSMFGSLVQNGDLSTSSFSNSVIRENKTNQITLVHANAVIIVNNFIGVAPGQPNGSLVSVNQNWATNIQVLGNIMYWMWSAGSMIQGGKMLFSNNLVIGVQSSLASYVTQTIFTNNIFYNVELTTNDNGNIPGGDLNTFNNNISFGGSKIALPPGSGNSGANNLVGVDPQFVNFPSAVGTNPNNASFDFHLKSTSPGHNKGTDGTDIGIYGGQYPFVLSSTVSLPIVQQLNVPSYILKGQNLNVQLKVKSF